MVRKFYPFWILSGLANLEADESSRGSPEATLFLSQVSLDLFHWPDTTALELSNRDVGGSSLEAQHISLPIKNPSKATNRH